jgi:maleylacetoacetate isomerase
VLVDGETELVQSLAIIEYLDEKYPEPPLLPRTPGERARVRGLALWVACEIQPLNNLRTQRQLAEFFEPDEATLSSWQLRWCEIGFEALERQLATSSATGRFCHGDSPTLADCAVVPQVYNSLRPVVGLTLEKYPTLARIYSTCLEHPAFEQALPRKQPGFVDPVGH